MTQAMQLAGDWHKYILLRTHNLRLNQAWFICYHCLKILLIEMHGLVGHWKHGIGMKTISKTNINTWEPFRLLNSSKGKKKRKKSYPFNFFPWSLKSASCTTEDRRIFNLHCWGEMESLLYMYLRCRFQRIIY